MFKNTLSGDRSHVPSVMGFNTGYISLSLSTFLFFGRQVLSIDHELVNSVGKLWGLLQSSGVTPTPGFSMGAKDSKSGSHVSTVNNSPTEPSPQSEIFILKVHVDREIANSSNIVTILIYRKYFDDVNIM